MLFSLLDNLEKQSVPVRNIILMNTEKKYFDQLASRVHFWEKYPNVKLHHLSRKEFDHGGTRHQAVLHSDAEVFVMMTQDAMPVGDQLLERLTGSLKDGVAVAYARQIPLPESPELEKLSRFYNYPAQSRVKTAADLKKMGIKTFFCSNVCAAYRRDVYEELGGFIRHTIFNEDMIYAAGAIKAGYGIAYVAEAEVLHSHCYTNLMQFRRNFDLGVSQADHPEVFGAVDSEAEGKKFVAEAWHYFRVNRCLHRFPGFCLQCAYKYAGYFLGKHYQRLPEKMIMRITTNKEYWRRNVR